VKCILLESILWNIATDEREVGSPANKSYVATKLKSWLRKFYSRHHDLIDRYEISISQMTMDILLVMLIFVFFHLLLLRLLADLTLSLYDDFIVNTVTVDQIVMTTVEFS
jgi:hypothetical protein